MKEFLTTLVERARGTAPVLRPLHPYYRPAAEAAADLEHVIAEQPMSDDRFERPLTRNPTELAERPAAARTTASLSSIMVDGTTAPAGLETDEVAPASVAPARKTTAVQSVAPRTIDLLSEIGPTPTKAHFNPVAAPHFSVTRAPAPVGASSSPQPTLDNSAHAETDHPRLAAARSHSTSAPAKVHPKIDSPHQIWTRR